MAEQAGWRTKLLSAAIVLIGIVISLTIAVPCGTFFMSPLRHDDHDFKAEWRVVATLSDLNEEGMPARFPVYFPVRNVWMRLPDAVGGYVFLRRIPETDEVVALHALHTPIGIDVVYDEQSQCFHSKCWRVDFDLNGAPMQNFIRSTKMPSLDTKVVDSMVYVRYTDFIESLK